MLVGEPAGSLQRKAIMTVEPNVSALDAALLIPSESKSGSKKGALNPRLGLVSLVHLQTKQE